MKKKEVEFKSSDKQNCIEEVVRKEHPKFYSGTFTIWDVYSSPDKIEKKL